MEEKIHIYQAHFYPASIERSGAWLIIAPNENKTDGLMMGWDKNRLILAYQFRGPDGMKIDRILCLDDSEPY